MWEYPHIWYSFLSAERQLDFSSWNLCRIPTFGTPIPCCPVGILGEFWASERCSGSGKRAGRESPNHIILQSTQTYLNVKITVQSIVVRTEQLFADKVGEDSSCASLANTKELIYIFREEWSVREMAAGCLLHTTCSGKQLTSDEGENTAFSSC